MATSFKKGKPVSQQGSGTSKKNSLRRLTGILENLGKPEGTKEFKPDVEDIRRRIGLALERDEIDATEIKKLRQETSELTKKIIEELTKD